MHSSFPLALALAAAAFASVDYEWTAQFKGNCVMVDDTHGNCTARANSQTLSTTISPQDAVTFDVTTLFGAYASLQNVISFQKDGSFAESGQISFGTHLSQSHTLYYRSFDFSGKQNQFDSLDAKIIFSMTAQVAGGKGAFNDAVGMISYQGYGQPDLSDFVTYVSFVISKPLNQSAPAMDAPMV
eukprot:TRINITY_DN17733_c0_g1_i1.p1 TRINITY_DN17733_c0_g1~~TRINITY_DN17733_c0_g1_i1.p1  ORF type:complete len:185 (+),score=26.20 TRINITY_DN17733_c0_g1_i1:253-807(+)